MSSATSTLESRTDATRVTDLPKPANAPEAAASGGRTILMLAGAFISSLMLTGWMESSSETLWKGRLEARALTIVAPRDTRIASIEIREGEEVVPGREILRLDAGSLSQQLADRERTLRDLEFDLQQGTARAEVDLAWRVEALDHEIHQTRLKSAELLKEKYYADLGSLAWSEFLSSRGDVRTASASPFSSALFELALPDEARIRALLQQEAAHNASEVFHAQVELCDRRLAELETLKQQLPRQVREAEGLPRIEARLAETRNEVESLREQLEELALTSPTYGTVGIFRQRAGDEVAAGAPLVTILDRGRQSIVMTVPTRYLHQFQTGMPMHVVFPGGERVEGILASIPPQAEVRPDGESVIDLRIEPVGKLWPAVPFGTEVTLSAKKQR